MTKEQKSNKMKLVESEEKKLKKVFADILGSSQKDIAMRLIKEIAYMSVTLDELKENMQPTERLVQGTQDMIIMSASLKGYNALIKNYTTALKQLEQMIPTGDRENKNDEFADFMKGRKQ